MHEPLAAVLRDKGTIVHSVSPTASVAGAVRRMNRLGVGALVVLEDDDLIGIFTERDVLRRVVDQGRDVYTTTVGDVMTRSIVTVRLDTTVEQAMSVMTIQRCRHLPVIDGDQLVGLISIGDLTRWVVRHQELEIRDLIDYVQGCYPR